MDLNSFGLSHEVIRSIADEHGTPVYIYNEVIIKDRYLTIYRSLQHLPLPTISYAIMANNRIPILETLHRLGASVQVNSPEEYRRAARVFSLPRKITVATTNISDGDFGWYGSDAYIYLDSLNELKRYGSRPAKLPHIGIRVQLTDVPSSPMVTNQAQPRVGVQPIDFSAAIALARRYSLRITGLHGYLASNVLDERVFLSLATTLLSYATHFPNVYQINLGGGFGIANLPEDSDFNFARFGKLVGGLLTEFSANYRRELLLRIEPGRFLVGPAGLFVTRVINTKSIDGVTYLGVDGSFGSFPRPYMYGVAEAGYHPVWTISTQSKRLYRTHICGCSTLQNDFLAVNRQFPATKTGDLLVFGNAGAYCASLASGFPGQKRAKEVFLTEDGRVIPV